MIKILQVGKYYPPVRGGMETHLQNLCQGLQDHVNLNVLVSHTGKETLEHDVNGTRVTRLGTLAKILGAPLCPGLRRGIMHSDADVVHIHLPNPTALLAYLLSGTKAKLVITYHSDIIRQRISRALIAPMQERAMECASAILVSSPNLIDSSAVLQRHRSRCHVVPFGITKPETENSVGHAAEVKRIRALGRGNPLILAVGRLVYYKGFSVLLEAMAKVSGASLILAGEGPLRHDLEKQIQALGLRDRVHLVGDVEDTAPYYDACDLFALPSVARSEAFGLVQIEAMLRGKPVVNTALESGVPYVSLDELTGLTVTPGCSDALAVALRRLIGDTGLRNRLGGAARQRAEDFFTVDQMVDATMDVYRSLQTAPAPARMVRRAVCLARESVRT